MSPQIRPGSGSSSTRTRPLRRRRRRCGPQSARHPRGAARARQEGHSQLSRGSFPQCQLRCRSPGRHAALHPAVVRMGRDDLHRVPARETARAGVSSTRCRHFDNEHCGDRIRLRFHGSLELQSRVSPPLRRHTFRSACRSDAQAIELSKGGACIASALSIFRHTWERSRAIDNRVE